MTGRQDDRLFAPERENALLRAELWRQWERNHSETCSWIWPHPEGEECHWPVPKVLSDGSPLSESMQ